MGYDVVAISDYQRSGDRVLSAIAEYEHEYNVRKRHQLAIGATTVA